VSRLFQLRKLVVSGQRRPYDALEAQIQNSGLAAFEHEGVDAGSWRHSDRSLRRREALRDVSDERAGPEIRGLLGISVGMSK
jgi:hypothetical protein